MDFTISDGAYAVQKCKAQGRQLLFHIPTGFPHKAYIFYIHHADIAMLGKRDAAFIPHLTISAVAYPGGSILVVEFTPRLRIPLRCKALGMYVLPTAAWTASWTVKTRGWDPLQNLRGPISVEVINSQQKPRRLGNKTEFRPASTTTACCIAASWQCPKDVRAIRTAIPRRFSSFFFSQFRFEHEQRG